jgi:hypothetical protein
MPTVVFEVGFLLGYHGCFPSSETSSNGVLFRQGCANDFAAIRLLASDSRGSNGGCPMISAVSSDRFSRILKKL